MLSVGFTAILKGWPLVVVSIWYPMYWRVQMFVWSVHQRRHDDQKNKDLTGFAFEHSLRSSHPPREANNLKSKSSSNYEGGSGSHSWWPSTSFRLQSITSPNLLFGLIFNLLRVFVVNKEPPPPKKPQKTHCHSSAAWVFKAQQGSEVFSGTDHTLSVWECQHVRNRHLMWRWKRAWKHSIQSEIRRFHLRHLATSPPRSWKLIMSWTQQKSEHRNFVIASACPRDLTFICPTAAKNFPTHQVFGLIVIQL